jgi:hypothetical protein
MSQTLEDRFASREQLAAYLSGRLEGLAGSVRYELTDEDREAAKVAARFLGRIAKLDYAK